MAYQKLLKQIAIKQVLLILLIAVFLSASFPVSASFAWLIFHKPEYRGKIIDGETKEPLEGVVVVAVYNTHTIIGGPAGGYSSVTKVKETLTDKTGEFLIPSYTTIMGPNSKEYPTDFIIYKPGYGRYPLTRPPDFKIVGPDEYFSKEIGTKGETYWGTKEERGPDGTVTVRRVKLSFTYGVVQLRPLSTREERRKALPGIPSEITSEEIPLLDKAIKKEDEWIWQNKGWRR